MKRLDRELLGWVFNIDETITVAGMLKARSMPEVGQLLRHAVLYSRQGLDP
jgi:hypothetical protein